jgi:probable phosphomutase (TIGR03848 family)
VPTCLLVRHGHSSANGEGILAGRTPGVRLTERGLRQAAALAARFAGTPLARVVSSPMDRCLETAAAIAEAVGVEVAVHEGLQECGYGAWTGRRLAELAQEPLWATVQDDPEAARFPDGGGYAAESLREMSDRAVAAVREIDAEVATADGEAALWVAVTHGDLVKAVLADATGTGLGRFQRFAADPASVSVVRYGGRHTFLLAANDLVPDLARFRAPETTHAVEGDGVPTSDAVVGGGTGGHHGSDRAAG